MGKLDRRVDTEEDEKIIIYKEKNRKTALFMLFARRFMGYTQQELADIIKKDRGLLSRYENGDTEPPGSVILDIIDILEFDVLKVLSQIES